MHLPGWGGGRSPGAAEVSDLWQCGSLCSEVRWGISAIPATLCYCNLEPSSFYWPGSQIWPGENSETWLCFCYFWSSLSPYLQFTLSLLQLVSNAIQFLASVCERPHYKHLFEDQNTLTSICEKVIVPNMEFRSKPSNYTWKCLEIQGAAFLDTHMLMCWVSLTRLTFNVGLGADEEAFEDNSEEYIRRDLEGSGKNASPSLKLNLNEKSFAFYLI